jgi:hypothetical protein
VQSTLSTPAANVALAHFSPEAGVIVSPALAWPPLLIGAEHQIRSTARKVARTSKRRSQVNVVPPGLGASGGLVICNRVTQRDP